MKILLLLPLVIFSINTFPQTLEGVNPEHLVTPVVHQSIKGHASKGSLSVQKIALKTGVTLDHVEKGNKTGTPVIFLHGLTDSWHSFESVFATLPSSVRGFAITQRGHGDSEKPAEGYTPREFAADVAAFIRQKSLGSAIIVGHSMGGIHAQQFALSYPKLVKGIVIIDSDPAFKDNPGMKEFYQEAMTMKGKFSRDYMDGFQKSTIANPIDSAYYRVIVAEGMKTPVRVFQSVLSGIMQVDFVPQLKNIQCPVLVLWGDKDAFCIRKGQDLMTTHLKKAKLVIYEGIGHALHWEEPKRFVNDLMQFIQLVQLNGGETNIKK